VLGPADHGSLQQLALQQRLIVRLPEVPTSGYLWRGGDALDADGPLRLVSSEFETHSPGAIGGAGLRCLVFEARAPGHCDLRLTCARAGSTDKPSDRWKLKMQVRS
jgi:predicted secreted protein